MSATPEREYLWDVRPNQFVERHLAELAPGTAIDLAAGEGRNAVWLAKRGWRSSRSTSRRSGSTRPLASLADHDVAERVETGECRCLTFVPREPVDLVVIAYLQIPLEEQRTALEHAATWLRPGGTLFVVAHDRSNVEHGYGGPPDAAVCYDLDETVAALAGLDCPRAEVAERRVETDDGPRTALDTLVIATRPAV